MEPKIHSWLLDIEQSIEEIYLFINGLNNFLDYKVQSHLNQYGFKL
jgi:hypothetical protein